MKHQIVFMDFSEAVFEADTYEYAYDLKWVDFYKNGLEDSVFSAPLDSIKYIRRLNEEADRSTS